MSKQALRELINTGTERCPECNCAIGEDWEYKPFSNKNIIVCPQCKSDIGCFNE